MANDVVDEQMDARDPVLARYPDRSEGIGGTSQSEPSRMGQDCARVAKSSTSTTPRADSRMHHDTVQNHPEVELPGIDSETQPPQENGAWSFGRGLHLWRLLRCGFRTLDSNSVTTYQEHTQLDSAMPIRDWITVEEFQSVRSGADLRDARARLEREWQFSVTILLAVVIVDAIIYYCAIDEVAGALALRCVTLSAISAVCGLVSVVYLQASSHAVYVHSARQNARSFHSSLDFLTASRAPLLFALASLLGLSSSLLLMAYSVSPRVVATICAVVTILLGLEYIVKALWTIWNIIHTLLLRVASALRCAGDG
ncbi:hypothetical protein PENSPDRAFT_694856 [Peniophora sp. CONT]|nr:hypothetical protein PENSPDRAFT_694856 [Peniophora sp. CONT]